MYGHQHPYPAHYHHNAMAQHNPVSPGWGAALGAAGARIVTAGIAYALEPKPDMDRPSLLEPSEPLEKQQWEESVAAYEAALAQAREDGKARLWISGFLKVAATAGGAAAGAAMTVDNPMMKRRVATYAAVGVGSLATLSMLAYAFGRDEPENALPGIIAGGVGASLGAKAA